MTSTALAQTIKLGDLVVMSPRIGRMYQGAVIV